MLICICSCCYNPEVLDEKSKNSLSIKYVAKRRPDQGEGCFFIEILDELYTFNKDGSPFFYNENKVPKMKHDFLVSLGYRWENVSQKYRNQNASEAVPVGWWFPPPLIFKQGEKV